MRTYYIYHKKSFGRPSGHILSTGSNISPPGYTKIGEIEANNKEQAYIDFISSRLKSFEPFLTPPIK
jgi:hypothetical protein